VLPEPFAQQALDTALRELLQADREPLRRSALSFADSHDLHGMHARILAEVVYCTHAYCTRFKQQPR
jgi:hypothetical protein